MVGEDPNSVFAFRSLLADLSRIKRANGFLSDVRKVKAPNYRPDEESLPAALLEPAPALLLWIDYEDDTEAVNSAEDRPELSTILWGIVKQEESLQESLLRLARDVRVVMRTNQNRSYPGSSDQNLWGVSTKADGKTFDFDILRKEEGDATGIFVSRWKIGYRFPRSTG